MQRVRLRHTLPIAILLPLQMVGLGATQAAAHPAPEAIHVEELVLSLRQAAEDIVQAALIDAQQLEADARGSAQAVEAEVIPEVEAVVEEVSEPTPAASPAASNGDLLACIRSYEQGAAGYGTNTGNGYYGAYQFDQSTWDNAVTNAGHPEWAGRRASEAPPEIQDAAAWQLYTERGLGPWPTPQRNC